MVSFLSAICPRNFDSVWAKPFCIVAMRFCVADSAFVASAFLESSCDASSATFAESPPRSRRSSPTIRSSCSSFDRSSWGITSRNSATKPFTASFCLRFIYFGLLLRPGLPPGVRKTFAKAPGWTKLGLRNILRLYFLVSSCSDSYLLVSTSSDLWIQETTPSPCSTPKSFVRTLKLSLTNEARAG